MKLMLASKPASWVERPNSSRIDPSTKVSEARSTESNSHAVATIARSFLVVADTTNLVTGLRVEDGLLEHLTCAMAGVPVGGLFYRSLSGILHNRFTQPKTVHALSVSQLFAQFPVRMRRYDAVGGVGAEHIKIAVREAAFALAERIKRLRFVLFHCGHCSLEHGFGLLCSAELS